MIKRACCLRSRASRPRADSWQDSAPCLAEAMLLCLRRCLPALEPLSASLGHGFRGKEAGAGATSLEEVLLCACCGTVLPTLASCHGGVRWSVCRGAGCTAASLRGHGPRSLRGDSGGRFPFQRSLSFVFFICQCCPAASA